MVLGSFEILMYKKSEKIMKNFLKSLLLVIVMVTITLSSFAGGIDLIQEVKVIDRGASLPSVNSTRFPIEFTMTSAIIIEVVATNGDREIVGYIVNPTDGWKISDRDLVVATNDGLYGPLTVKFYVYDLRIDPWILHYVDYEEVDGEFKPIEDGMQIVSILQLKGNFVQSSPLNTIYRDFASIYVLFDGAAHLFELDCARIYFGGNNPTESIKIWYDLPNIYGFKVAWTDLASQAANAYADQKKLVEKNVATRVAAERAAIK